jgi:hypothetical protein
MARPRGSRGRARRRQVTVKVPALLTVPAGAVVLVTDTRPDVAPVGTLAWSFVDEIKVTVEAITPLNLTAELEVKPTPVIVTNAPGAPLVGLNAVIDSVGVKLEVLVPVPPAVVTPMWAGTAPLGTMAVIEVPDVTVGVAARVPNFTVAPGTNPVPVIVTELPVIPFAGANELMTGAP